MVRRARLLALALVAAACLVMPGRAMAAPVYKKYGPIIVESWDHYGVFHRLILRLVVVFPKQPMGLPHNIESQITQKLQALPYEMLRNPQSSALIKSITLKVMRESKPGKAAEKVLIDQMFFY